MGTAVRTGRALAGNAHLVAVTSARRNTYGNVLAAILETKLELGAAQSRDEIDADLAGDVGALHALARAATAGAAEQVPEQIPNAPRGFGAGSVEQIFYAGAGTATASATTRHAAAAVGARCLGVEPFTQTFLAELVVEAALFLVGQGLVRTIHDLEARFRLLVVGVLVGMELGGELSVSLLELVVAGGSRYPKVFVKVSSHGSS